MTEKENLKDVGGWLLFFIITLVIISPLFNLYLLFSQIDFLMFTDIIEMLASISLFILTGIFLWTKKPYAVQFAKVFLITTFIVNIVSSFLLSDFSYIAQGTIYFIIWILYLNKSERVKQVYGNLKEKSEGTQIWPIVAIIYAFLAPVFGAVFAIIGLIKISKNRKLNGMVLSIIALVVSILFFLLLFGYGMLQGANFDYVPEDIEIKCNDYCYDVDGATSYLIEYNYGTSSFICYCTDDYGNNVDQKSFPYTLE